MSRIWGVIVIIGAVMAIVAVSLGAHIYRWEMIVWPATAILLVITAWIYQTMADR